MMPPDGFERLAAAIAATGVDPETAEDWAYLIGDRVELSDDERWVIVRDDQGKELGRVPASVLEE